MFEKSFQGFKQSKVNLPFEHTSEASKGSKINVVESLEVIWAIDASHPQLGEAYEKLQDKLCASTNIEAKNSNLIQLTNLNQTFGVLIKEYQDDIDLRTASVEAEVTKQLAETNQKKIKNLQDSKKKLQSRFKRSLFDLAITREFIINLRKIISGYDVLIKKEENTLKSASTTQRKYIIWTTETPKDESTYQSSVQNIRSLKENKKKIQELILDTEGLSHGLYSFIRGTYQTVVNKTPLLFSGPTGATTTELTRECITGAYKIPETITFNFPITEPDSDVSELLEEYLSIILQPSDALFELENSTYKSKKRLTYTYKQDPSSIEASSTSK